MYKLKQKKAKNSKVRFETLFVISVVYTNTVLENIMFLGQQMLHSESRMISATLEMKKMSLIWTSLSQNLLSIHVLKMQPLKYT